MSGEPFPPELDPDRSNVILIAGRKGSGKSVHARLIYDSYPFDKLVVDPTGDAEPGPDADEMTPPFPRKFPVDGDGRPRNLHCKVDPGSATYREDMDKAMAMGLFPRDHPCMVWIDEVGEMMTAHSTPPHMRTALMSSRHYGPLSIIMAGPRPMHISPLSISQADRVVIYDLPNPKDVERLADNMGYAPARLKRAVDETEQRNADARKIGDDPFWHLVYDRDSKQLWRMPPVPVVAHRGPPA